MKVVLDCIIVLILLIIGNITGLSFGKRISGLRKGLKVISGDLHSWNHVSVF